ncbi:uncharacterized protein PMUG01_10012500 [Plasmodium malariae]|uniref:Uncharacterized protein n=1 Tax=Plasmodium malariae TaxID=5858 RepID=A0A1D3RHA8_PLAMA|nr:uncharacterized protein PMUG01_10012500 [Plasmodium malariae]SCN44559.1 hypothetical protein PMUG01_10012500 [Plasmodium malariae]
MGNITSKDSLNFQRHHVYSANDYTASNIPNSSNISISNELSLENGNLTFNFFVNYLILLLPLISILLTIPIAKYLYNNTPVGTCYNKTCNYVSGDTNKNEGHFANTNIESPKVITENKTYTEHSSTTQRDTRTGKTKNTERFCIPFSSTLLPKKKGNIHNEKKTVSLTKRNS